MKSTLLPLLLFILLADFGYGQSGNTSIKGSVVTSDGKPADFVSVMIKNTNIGTTTDIAGKYILKNIRPGNYLVVVSGVGIARQEKQVLVEKGKTSSLDFSLGVNAQQLTEVEVSVTQKKYKIDRPSTSLRLNEPLLEVPQNIQVVTSQTLADQQVISMSDGLIRNVSGAVRLEHWGDMYTNINMRGSQVQAFRNGFNVVASYWGPLTEDMSFVDHIEFVKGPAGFMLASGDPAGLYNVVTKKPTGQTKAEVSFTAGSYDLYRATADLDGKISKNGKLLYRLNIAGQNKNSFRPFEYNDRYSLAPVVSYQFDENTKLTAEYTLQHAKMTEVGSYYVFSPNGYAGLPSDFTLTQPNIPATRISDNSAFLNFEHRFSTNWKINAQGSYFRYNQVGYSSWPSSVNTDGSIIRNVGIWDAQSSMRLGQVFVNGDMRTGFIRHRILSGIDVGKKSYIADWGQSHDLDTAGAAFNVNNPNYGSPVNGLPSFDRTTSLEERAKLAGGLMDSKYTGLYLQDELGFLDNRLRLTLAGRYTFLSQANWGGTPDKAKHFTPRVGLSVSIDDQTSAYAVYDQAFIPQTGVLAGGGSVKPITGNNMEFGLKKDWFHGNWNTTFSVYRILKENELTADPNSPPTSGLSIVLGQKRAQGIEFDLRGRIVNGLNVVANYALTDSRVTRVAPGVTSYNVGDKVPNFAKHTINTWLNYGLQKGKLKGVGVSGGFTYLIDRSGISWTNVPGALSLPNYFKLDAGLFYEHKKLRVNANAFNVLNQYLYSGAYYAYLNAYYWQAEAGRNARLSIAYKF